MSYDDAYNALTRVSADLRRRVEEAISDYVLTRSEVNSRTLAARLLKKFGYEWKSVTKDNANQAMGILIKQVLVNQLKWDDKHTPEVSESRSYYTYTNPEG